MTQVTWKRETGNLKAESIVAFYRDDKPQVSALPGCAILFLGSKSKEGIQREKLAVSVSKVLYDDMNSKSRAEFVESLILDHKQKLAGAVLAGELPHSILEDVDSMVTDYNDTSRNGGERISADKVKEYILASNVAEYLTLRMMQKNAQMNEETLKRGLSGWAEMFGKLTQINPQYSDEHKKLIRMILDNTEDDGSKFREYIVNKFAKVEAKATEEAELVNFI